MASYIVRRLIQAVIVLWIVSIAVFIITRLMPGDPVLLYLTSETYDPELLDILREEHGLNDPLPLQYFTWVKNIFTGSLGMSFLRQVDVTTLIGYSLPISLHLGVVSYIISLIIGIPLGIIAALRRGTWIDNVATSIANLGITAPQFWVGIMLIYFFGLYLDWSWLPIRNYVSPFDDFWASQLHIILPAFCLAIFPMAGFARQTRSSMLEIIHQDYIRTAWSKGLNERTIVVRHALKNGLTPVVTMAGMQVRGIFGGQVLIERVFNIPGMGDLVTYGVVNQDYAIVQGVVIVIAGIVVIMNMITDLSYGWLDPRVRYG